MGWSITPITGVDNPETQDGKYIFTPQAEDITYTITYTDDKGLKGTINYTVKPTDCMVCDCSKFTFTQIVSTIPADGYTSDVILGTLTGYCIENGRLMDSYINPVVTYGADAVTSISTGFTDDNIVNVYAKINPNPGNTRTIKIRFDIVSSYMMVKESCSDEYTFTQTSNDCYREDAPTVTPSVINNVPSAGDEYTVHYYTTSCWVQEYVKFDSEIIELVAADDNFEVLENDSADPRQTIINYGFRNTTTGELAIRPVEINQLGNECVSSQIPYVRPTEITNMTPAGGSFNNSLIGYNSSCWTVTTGKSGADQIESVVVNENTAKSMVTVKRNEGTTELISYVNYTFTNKVDSSITGYGETKIIQKAGCSCDSVTYVPPTDRTIDSYADEQDSVQITLGKFTSLCEAEFSSTRLLVAEILTGVTYLDDYPGAPSGMPAKYSKLYWDAGMEDETPVFAKIKPNHSFSNRNIKFKFVFIDPNNNWDVIEECPGTYEFVQTIGCVCNTSISYTASTELPSEEMENVQFGFFIVTKPDCSGNFNVVIDEDSGNIVNGVLRIDNYVGGYRVLGNVTNNTTSYEKTIKYHIEMEGTSCEQQTAVQPVGCKCEDITVIFEGDGSHKFDLNVQNNVVLCQIQINNSCVNPSNDMFIYETSSFTQIRIGNKIGSNPDVYNVMADLPALNDAKSTSFSVKVGNDLCGPFMIYRTCFCGTDNCKVVFPDGSIESYPLHLDSKNGTYADIQMGDKVYIPVDVLMDRNGNNIPATGTSATDSYQVYTTDDDGQTWCKVYYYVQNNIGYLHYICEDNTGPQRKATFTFKVPNNTILRSDVRAPERWVGKTCCSPFTVELMQASVGHRFAKDGVCRKSGFSNYIEVDLDDPREDHSNLVDCSE